MNQEPNIVRLPGHVARTLETLLGLEVKKLCRYCVHFDVYSADPSRGACAKRDHRAVPAYGTCGHFDRR